MQSHLSNMILMPRRTQQQKKNPRTNPMFGSYCSRCPKRKLCIVSIYEQHPLFQRWYTNNSFSFSKRYSYSVSSEPASLSWF